MTLWWLQPGWTDARCAQCGSKIYPEGDPDWGLCWPCMLQQQAEAEHLRDEEDRYLREMARRFGEHPHG